jgi:hypothetical protein
MERTHSNDSNATMGEKIANLYIGSRTTKFDLFSKHFVVIFYLDTSISHVHHQVSMSNRHRDLDSMSVEA